MTYTDPDDGITYLSRGESWRVSGPVEVKMEVAFETAFSKDEPGFRTDLLDALCLTESDVGDINSIEILDRSDDGVIVAEVVMDVYVIFTTGYEPDEKEFEEATYDALDDLIGSVYDVLDESRLELELEYD